MISREQVAHDLALIHAQEKYREFFDAIAPGDRQERNMHGDLQELAGFYLDAFNFFLEAGGLEG